MARVKRRQDWSPVEKKQTEHFPLEAARRILKISRAPCQTADETALHVVGQMEIAADLFLSRRLLQEGPSLSEIGAALRNLRAKAVALDRCLQHLDFRTAHDYLLPNEPEFLEQVSMMVNRLAYAARKGCGKLPKGKMGRPEDVALQGFIRAMERIYQELTGRKPGVRTSFIRLVNFCLVQVGEPRQSTASLKMTISRMNKKA